MIGIFDSGLGGLITLREIVKTLPEYQYIYLGDSARMPYGNRSQELIYKFTLEAVDFLFKKGCQLIIIACNPASAEALRKIQQEYLPKYYPDRRVLGVIRPIAEKAAAESRVKVGVIGTKGTINSGVYKKELNKLNSSLEILELATPLLVPMIEEGNIPPDVVKKILRKYLRPLKLAKIDTLILGCTHYPIWQKEIQGIVGRKIKVLNSPRIIAESLADYLVRHPEIGSKLNEKSADSPGIELFVTDISPHYEDLKNKWFGDKLKFNKVELAPGLSL
jgi:glutamate racemase